jgi:hypothetical protein
VFKLRRGLLFLLVSALYSTTAVAGNAFPHIVSHPTGNQPEGFAIGRGHTAYSGSMNGLIYKSNLRTGQGEILASVPDPFGTETVALGMRFDSRTNYLFIAGGITGKAFVYDADSGALVAEYQLGPDDFTSLVNDLTITKDAVYFTDSFRPFFYRLPLSQNGALSDPAAVEAIPLSGDFDNEPGIYGVNSNGIVSSADGKVLIIGHSSAAKLYRVDPNSGHADVISADVVPFPDGLILSGKTLYIVSPKDPGPRDQVQVLRLDKKMLSGKTVGAITDPSLEGAASGARFGNSLYVINSRWLVDPAPNPATEYWITKLGIHDIQP